MVIRKTGDTFKYEGITYTIGGRIYANGQSDWEGLFGVITEIRTGSDKETENESCTGNQRKWRISVWMR